MITKTIKTIFVDGDEEGLNPSPGKTISYLLEEHGNIPAGHITISKFYHIFCHLFDKREKGVTPFCKPR